MFRVALACLLTLALQTADTRKAIQDRYDAWSKAYMANDVGTLLSILTPDYTLTTSDGTLIKRSEYEAMLRLRKSANSDTKKYLTRILRIKVSGETAEVESRETMTGTVQDAATGKTLALIHEHDYSDTWTHASGAWLLRKTVTLKERSHSGK
ncbi:MAG TPA: nuclear transport factor 2 family protein [Fimbriimonadaceae bacterium]|nr:nuclear transport factor 2 family protein [Fimbriimonadaceae bacterium]